MDSKLSDPRIAHLLTSIFELVDDFLGGKIDKDTLFDKSEAAVKRLVFSIERKKDT